jgi:hypothetical protein
VLTQHPFARALHADNWLQDQQATHQRNEMMVGVEESFCL